MLRRRGCGAQIAEVRRTAAAAQEAYQRSTEAKNKVRQRPGAAQAMHDQYSRFIFRFDALSLCIGQQAARCLMQARGRLAVARTCTHSVHVWAMLVPGTPAASLVSRLGVMARSLGACRWTQPRTSAAQQARER